MKPVPPRVAKPGDRAKILAALASPTASKIADRLAMLRPSIRLEDHIHLSSDFVVKPTLIEGLEFVPVDVNKLYYELVEARDFTGKKAFTDPLEVEYGHWPLKLSMMATKGVGFREVGRAFLAEPLKLKEARQPWSRPQIDIGFGSQFGGTQAIKLDISSLHWALKPDLCSVHLDHSGFTIDLDTGEAVGPDSVQHILDELLLKDKFAGLFPPKVAKYIRRITFIYPNSHNGFSRWGSRLGETRILKKIAELPAIGPTLGKVRLPGVSIELYRGSKFKVSYTYSCGVASTAGCAHTLEAHGVF